MLLTHPHADHTHGIDDLRPLVIAMRRRIEIYMDEATSAVVRAKFSYIFETPEGSSYPPILRERRLTAGAACLVEGPGGPIEAIPFLLEHGDIPALGFRIGALAYTPDLNGIPEAKSAAAGRPRRLDRRRAALCAASLPLQPGRDAGLDRTAATAPGDPDQPSH